MLFIAVSEPTCDASDLELAKSLGQSPFITDAKALYDAANNPSAGMGLQEKQTANDIKVINERLASMGGEPRVGLDELAAASSGWLDEGCGQAEIR